MNKLETVIKLQYELQEAITDLQDELYGIQEIIKKADIMGSMLQNSYFNELNGNNPKIISEFEGAKDASNIILDYIAQGRQLLDDLMEI